MNCSHCGIKIDFPQKYFFTLCIRCGQESRIALIIAKLNDLKQDVYDLENDK